MTFDFEVHRVQEGDVHVVAVHGEVDIFTAPELRGSVLGAIDDGARDVVVDLSETRFVDSTGLGVLIGALKRLRPIDGRLIVVNTEPTTQRTLAITGLDELLIVVPTRAEAIARLTAAQVGD